MEINKNNTSIVLLGKFLAADSSYIGISGVVRNQDPINVMVVMVGLTENMGWLATNQELAEVQIVISVVYVAKN